MNCSLHSLPPLVQNMYNILYIYIYIISVTDKISRRLKYIVGSGHGMFKFVRTHSQLIRDHPLTDTIFLYVAWKYKPSQPIGDHPLWPCPICGLSVILFATHTLNIHSGNQTRQRNISIYRGFSHVNLYSQVISHCHVWLREGSKRVLLALHPHLISIIHWLNSIFLLVDIPIVTDYI